MEIQDVLLFESIDENDLEKACAAILKGANINALDPSEMQPLLHYALSTNYIHEETILWLLNQGADAVSLGFFKETAIIAMCRGRETEYDELGDHILQILIKKGVDINALDMSKNSALDYAVMNQDAVRVADLIRLGASINEETLNGPLIGAIYRGNLNVFQVIFTHLKKDLKEHPHFPELLELLEDNNAKRIKDFLVAQEEWVILSDVVKSSTFQRGAKGL